LIEKIVIDKVTGFSETSENFRFSAAVASFGMLLRDSEYKGKASFSGVLDMAKASTGKDQEGYRAEFIQMIKSCKLMSDK